MVIAGEQVLLCTSQSRVTCKQDAVPFALDVAPEGELLK